MTAPVLTIKVPLESVLSVNPDEDPPWTFTFGRSTDVYVVQEDGLVLALHVGDADEYESFMLTISRPKR